MLKFNYKIYLIAIAEVVYRMQVDYTGGIKVQSNINGAALFVF